MKAILLLFLLIAFSLAQNVRRRPTHQDYDEEEDFSFGQSHVVRRSGNFRPIGREICNCCRFRKGQCVEMECCQSYKDNNKFPTLNKP